jgi:hypothetical protein
MVKDASERLKTAQHSVHPTGGSRRVFERFAWLGVGSGKVMSSRPAHPRVTQAVRRTHPQKGNHGNTDWKVLVLWKNDSNVALRRYNRWRNVSHCMFRVQRKRLPTKRTVDHLMALGWLAIFDWFYCWYVLCGSPFRRQLMQAVMRTEI